MVQQHALLNERQVAVLKWIHDGCPDGVWIDFSDKRTTYALADRKLVIVDKRRGSWSASITANGHYYLEHGTYKIEQPSSRSVTSHRMPRGVAPSDGSADSILVSPVDLLVELQNAESGLTLKDPSHGVRAAYRSAISRAVSEGLVAEGYALRHKGRDKGDLVIRLVRLDDVPPPIERLPAVPVPETLHGSHAVVRMLRDNPDMLDVSDQSRRRASLLVQALADECTRRGYEVPSREDADGTFWIGLGEDRFTFTMSEEFERREVLDAERLSTAKYPWQRVPSTVRQVRSGRLVLRLGAGHDVGVLGRPQAVDLGCEIAVCTQGDRGPCGRSSRGADGG